LRALKMLLSEVVKELQELLGTQGDLTSSRITI